jgi:anti-sigma factor RsiW
VTDTPHHPSDELHLLLDQRLPAAARAGVEAHLATCPRCRRELAALRRVKAMVTETAPQHAVPPEVVARISGALAAEDAGAAGRRARSSRVRRLAAGLGLGLTAAAILLLVLARRGSPDVVAAAAGDFASYRAGTLSLQLETADPRALERFFVAGRVSFATRVFDFGMMGYRLAGGRVHRVSGRASAFFTYEKAEGGRERVLCQMYQGSIPDLVPGAEEREHEGIRFRIYRAGGLTLVFWQEGPVVCVLVTDGDTEAAIQLAFAKAVKV